MSSRDRDAVRPTRRALDDMGLVPPPVDQPLHELDNRQVQAMQAIPAQAVAQALKRIRSLKDRPWFKYKSGNARAAVTKLAESEVSDGVIENPKWGRGWIGAFEHRQADTGQKDFYSRLEAECERQAKGT